MLTDLGIKNIVLPDRRRELPDGRVSGLFLVVQPTGAKSWAVRYRVNGQSKKLTIGAYPTVDLATARARAKRALGEAADGKDPAAAKVAARAAARAEREADADRVERVAEIFVDRYAKVKTRDWRETKRMLDNEIVARWRGRRLSQITKSQVVQMLDEIVARGAPIRANRVFAQLRKMSNWAVARGLIDRSPCADVETPSDEKERDRKLTNDEIRYVWRASDAIGWPFGPFVKLLFLTGARRDEVAGMTRNELDLSAIVCAQEDGQRVEVSGLRWTIPAARSKNKRAHVVPLVAHAAEIIADLPAVESKRGFIFTTTGTTPISGYSRAKSMIDAAVFELMRERAEIEGIDPKSVEEPPPWTFHDIRRTVATNLQRLGIRLEVTEAVLNHVSGSRSGIVKIYQQHDYANEKRAALDAWARRLDEIVTGQISSNVVELSAARGAQ